MGASGLAFALRLALVALVQTGCARPSAPERERRDAIEATLPYAAAPSAGPALAQQENALAPSSAPTLPRPNLPPEWPDMAAQRAVCWEQGFGYLTPDAFVVHALEPQRRIASIALTQPSNAVVLSGAGALLFTQDHVWRYRLGQQSAPRFVRIARLGPFEVWPDAQNIDGFWVRYLRDPALHYYVLQEPSTEGPRAVGSIVPKAVTLGTERALAGYDLKAFTLLSDGTPLYSSAEQGSQLVWASSTHAKRFTFAAASEQRLLPDARWDRFWALNRDGEVGLWELSRGEPRVLQQRLPGTPLAWTRSAGKVAVLSWQASRAWLSILDSAAPQHLSVEQQHGLELLADSEQLARATGQGLSLCFVPQRPWLLLSALQHTWLVDYRDGKVLWQVHQP